MAHSDDFSKAWREASAMLEKEKARARTTDEQLLRAATPTGSWEGEGEGEEKSNVPRGWRGWLHVTNYDHICQSPPFNAISPLL